MGGVPAFDEAECLIFISEKAEDCLKRKRC